MKSAGKQIAPIQIIKKNKGHGGGAHGGAWKVAYADFVTAMMALFIVLWITGQNGKVKEAVAAYFKDPGAFTTTRSGGILPGAAPPSAAPKPLDPISPAREPQNEMERLKQQGKRIEEMISSVKLFDQFKDRIQIQVSQQGLQIELIENSSGLFFDVGSAHVKKEAVQLLELVASEITKLPNSVIIEGYTDARPFVSTGYSNWELSVDRANSARKVLETHGLRKDQVQEVRGFADRKLRDPDHPNDYSNRRITISVIPIKPLASQNVPADKTRASQIH